MFLHNLNVFVACLFIGGMTMGGSVGILVMLALGGVGAVGYAYPISYLLIAAVLAVVWWRVGLSPLRRKPERERRFRLGHGLLALTNILAVLSLTVPFLLATATGNSNIGMLAWFAVPVYALGFLAWPAGLFMVWSSPA